MHNNPTPREAPEAMTDGQLARRLIRGQALGRAAGPELGALLGEFYDEERYRCTRTAIKKRRRPCS